MNDCVIEWMDACMYVCVDREGGRWEWRSVCMNICSEAGMNGGWMDEWMNGWMDECIDTYYLNIANNGGCRCMAVDSPEMQKPLQAHCFLINNLTTKRKPQVVTT